jgi:cytoskeletal protein CcmA (bactofilin family)/anti-sigma factor RsiW
MSSPPESNLQHLDEMTLLLYLERQLERERAGEVSTHMQECGACRTLLRALERESRLLTRAMLEEEEPLPARLAGFQQAARRSLQWVWMLTFGLAATGIYALYTSYIEPVQNRLQDAGFGGTNLLGLLIFQGAFWKGWQSMISFVEILALIVIGGSAALLFRRWFRRGMLAALLMAGMCGALMLPESAAAFESRKGESIEVTKDEKIKGDLLLTGHRIVVDGNVDGDVYAFGQDIEINGHITGDLITGAETVRVTGQIDGNVRAFVNTVTVPGSVGRNLMAWAQVVNVDSAGKVGRSVTTFCQNLGIDGKVGGDVVAFDQSTRITGNVEGGVQAKGETMTIKGTAQVTGAVKFEGETAPRVEEGAKLAAGPVSYTKHQAEGGMESRSGYYIWRLLWSSSFILYGLVLIWLMPKFAGDCVTSAENVGASLGLGVLVFISLPIAAVLVCVTFVGLPLGILGLLVWFVLMFSAQIVFGALIGRWILGRTEDTWGRVGRMALGMAIIGVVVPILHQVPITEFLFKLVVVFWGFGAIVLTLYKRIRLTPSIPIPPPVPALA